jgi:fatty acid amide hydrolase 2
MAERLETAASPRTNALAQLEGHGALGLAQLIRRREISSRELTEISIEAIEQVNPRLNAVVVERFEAALGEADEADRALQRGNAYGALWGVPCTVKETFGLAGYPQSAGSVYRRHVRAERDATAIARIRLAGAIPLGLTNVPEMAMWMESDNLVYGRTGNPYDYHRTAGGSSGGEAAIIGSGAMSFGIGSDVGGSIRMPAAFCGIFGHKPSGGLVPLTGHYPPAPGLFARFCCAGPMTREAADLMPLLRIVAGPEGDGSPPPTDDALLPDPHSVSFADRRVYTCERFGGLVSPPQPTIRMTVRAAAAALADRGARVAPWRHGLLPLAMPIWGSMLAGAGGPTFGELISADGRGINVLGELLRSLRGDARHMPEALVLAALDDTFLSFDAPRAAFSALGRRLRSVLDTLLDDGSVLLLPVHPRVAPKHRQPLRYPLDWIYTALFNVMELPATSVPMGLDADGLPLAVQVVAAHGNDHLTIAAALALEQAYGGWVSPQRR